MSSAESLAPPTREELILDAVRRRMGEPWEIWTRFETIPTILKSRWGELSFLLDGKVIPTEVVWLLGYEAALGDGCPRCVASMRSLLIAQGVAEQTMADVETSIQGGTMGFHAKFVLIYGAAIAYEPHRMSKKALDAFLRMNVAEQELLQAAETVGYFRSLFDVQHSLGLHNPEQMSKKPRRFKLKKEHLR